MAGIIEHFSNLSDPRTKEHKKEHKLIDILFITIAAVICGAEDWNDIEYHGEEKERGYLFNKSNDNTSLIRAAT